MTFIDHITSALRFLAPAERVMASTTQSERAVAEIARRMGVRLP